MEYNKENLAREIINFMDWRYGETCQAEYLAQWLIDHVVIDEEKVKEILIELTDSFEYQDNNPSHVEAYWRALRAISQSLPLKIDNEMADPTKR